MFVVRCGLRVRGLMQHPLVGVGVDRMLSLGRKACLDPRVVDGEFIATLRFLKGCAEDEEMPGIDDHDDVTSASFWVEAVAVSRVFDEIRHWHDQNGTNTLWTAGNAAAESENAIAWMEVEEEQRSLWLDAHYRGLMSDLEHAKSWDRTKAHNPAPNGPWGPLWPGGPPDWFEEAERARPLTSPDDWNKGWPSGKSGNEPSWRYLEKIVKQTPQVEEIRLPAREKGVAPEDLDKEIAEFEATLRRAVQLIDADPATAERLLPSLGLLAKRIQESGHLMRTKEVAEALCISQGRVNQLAKLQKITCTDVLGVSTFARTEIVELAKTNRPPGRPRQS